LAAIPTTEKRLEQLLDLDTDRNLRDGKALRISVEMSRVSRNHRVLERHQFRGRPELYDQSRAYAYWRTHDFASRDGRKNVFQFPRGSEAHEEGFERDGGEMIFELPNGLHGYMIVNRSGGRLDRAPLSVVQNDDRSDPAFPAIENGRSCMMCHDVGIKLAEDSLLPEIVAEWSRRRPDRWAGVARLHEQGRWIVGGRTVLERDLDSYVDSIRRLQVDFSRERRWQDDTGLILEYNRDLDIAEVALELGVSIEMFTSVLADTDEEALLPFAPLLVQGRRIARSTFASAFQDVHRLCQAAIARADSK
jgi:hypothetical protein